MDPKFKLKLTLDKFLEYDPEKPKIFPVPPPTVHNFYECFMDETYQKLREIAPGVIRSFTLCIKDLTDLIALEPSALYVKISLIQIPDGFQPRVPNQQMAEHAGNLYLLFTLANGHNQPHLCEYFDLNYFNNQVVQVHPEDARLCLEEFHAIGKSTSLRRAMLEVHPSNTEHIYVNIPLLQNNFINNPELSEMKCVTLVFCQIDKEDNAARSAGFGNMIDTNDKRFACLWKAIDQEHRIMQYAPVYDFNSLCPNMCP